jgi:hypothetical protein
MKFLAPGAAPKGDHAVAAGGAISRYAAGL